MDDRHFSYITKLKKKKTLKKGTSCAITTRLLVHDAHCAGRSLSILAYALAVSLSERKKKRKKKRTVEDDYMAAVVVYAFVP